jgi:hypothetical protein
MRGALLEMLTYPPPHLKFTLLGNKTQVCRDQASFLNVLSTKTYEGVVVM